MRTNKEFIHDTQSLAELWGSKYVFESWITTKTLIDTRTNQKILPGTLVFCLISYIDKKGNTVTVDETQYITEANE